MIKDSKILQYRLMPEVLAILGLFLYLSPNIFFFNHAHYLVHDILFPEVGWYKMIAESGLAFSSSNAIFPNVYNGIPRGCMPTELDYYTILNLIFKPLMAYNINIILQHVVAFAGMYLLLKSHVFGDKYRYHVAFLSLAFGLLPFWPMGELCVAGQPLLVWAFINLLKNKSSWKEWLILILFPFFSSDFVYSNLFLSAGLFLFIIIYSIIEKKWSILPFTGWFVFVLMGLISGYRLITLVLIEHIEGQRQNYSFFTALNWKGYLNSVLSLFFRGQYHFYSNQYPIIILTTMVALFLTRIVTQRRVLGLLLLSCLVFSFADCLHYWSASKYLFLHLGALTTVQLRFETMFPALWHIAFACGILFILIKYPSANRVTLLVIIVQVFCQFFPIFSKDYQGSKYSENAFYYSYCNKQDNGHKSFDDYYCPDLLNNVKQKIGYKNETVLCIGFNSEIAQYNKINTAAAYLDFFPLSKQQQLENIFLPEVKKISDTIERMKELHSRTFEFYVYNKDMQGNSINDLSLDTAAMKVMKIRYVLSLYPIKNHSQLGLDSMACIENDRNVFPKQISVYSFR